MVWSNVREMWQEVQSEIELALPLVYASSAVELQVVAINSLADIADRVESYRILAIQRQNNHEANSAFVMIQWIAGLSDLLCMWVQIKQDRMDDAWESLVSSQEHLNCGVRFQKNDGVEDVIRHLYSLEKTIFPPQIFTSCGYIFDHAICTICDGVYGDCEHVSGKLYMGRMCGRKLANLRVHHNSIVDHPADKGCRLTAVQHGKEMRCKLTSRKVEELDVSKASQEPFKISMILMRAASKFKIRRVVLSDNSVDVDPVELQIAPVTD